MRPSHIPPHAVQVGWESTGGTWACNCDCWECEPVSGKASRQAYCTGDQPSPFDQVPRSIPKFKRTATCIAVQSQFSLEST